MKKTRKISALFMSIIMLINLSLFCTISASAADTTDFTIKIVHTNDIHARVVENEKGGIIGIERLAGIIDENRKGSDLSLVLDSGDMFHGQSIATLVQGESIARLMKECGYNAMTAGNHDWSYGKDRLTELVEMSGADMLCGNVVDENGNPFFEYDCIMPEVVKDGKKLTVGVFGLIDPAVYSSTAPSNVAGLSFMDPVEYANKIAQGLKNDGCDVVIALAHTYKPEELAKQVDGVDLWLCGHEHIDINTTVTTPNGSTAIVIENGYYLYRVGLIELNVTMDESGNITFVDYNTTSIDYESASVYEKNANVTAALDKINKEQSVILNKVVGKSPEELDGVWEHLRIDETNLGRAVTAAYLKATGADVSFENAGGIRASVKAGEITYGDIISVSPYGNIIVTKQVTGKQLREILETSIDIQLQCIEANDSGIYDAWPKSSGSYLQTGGMTVEYNPSLEAGKRVVSVKVGEKPLDENKLYTVATNNFVAVSSYYPQLAEAEETGEFCACDEALIEFFKQDSAVIEQAVTKQGMIKTSKTADGDVPKTGVEDMTFVVVLAAAVLITALAVRKKAAE